ncbi:MAG: nicotinate-nucleotide adenylyltransferase [Hyphomicrobiaceae bacterium]
MPPRSRPGRLGWVQAKTPLAMPGQRIGILGGSFNPPHAGHAQISNIALARLQLDRLWWLVTPGNPLKSNGQLPSLETRMDACRQLMPSPMVEITGFEAELGTPYTAATLEFLSRRYPECRFVWIMGADNLATFHRWQSWRSIAAHVPIAVVDRPGWRLKAIASPAARYMYHARMPEDQAALLPMREAPAWTLLSGPLSPLSSTALRQKLPAPKP